MDQTFWSIFASAEYWQMIWSNFFLPIIFPSSTRPKHAWVDYHPLGRESEQKIVWLQVINIYLHKTIIRFLQEVSKSGSFLKNKKQQ